MLSALAVGEFFVLLSDSDVHFLAFVVNAATSVLTTGAAFKVAFKQILVIRGRAVVNCLKKHISIFFFKEFIQDNPYLVLANSAFY